MSAWLESLEAPLRRPARKPAPSVAAPRPRERRLAGGIVWIAIVAVLLTGVVALNVAVLRLNVRLDELGRERTRLHEQNAALASKLSSIGAPPRIESVARKQLGLVPAGPEQISYVDLAPRPK